MINMRILSKEGNELVLLSITDDAVEKGDYVLIEDIKSKRKLIVQVYEEEYLNIPSLIQDIVKDEIVTGDAGVLGKGISP